MGKINSSTFWAVAIIAIVVVGLIVIRLAGPTDQGGSTNTDQDDWFKGSTNAAVTLIEYSDFQCPACGSYFPFLKRLNEEFPDDLKFVYRHFPLKTIHPRAELAAYAAEAAGAQGQFWQMHDKLFENQRSWSDMSRSDAEDTFIAYANDLGLDAEQFRVDLANDDIKRAVRDDVRSANSARVNSTPSIFLNGSKINNPNSYDGLRQLVLDAIAGQ